MLMYTPKFGKKSCPGFWGDGFPPGYPSHGLLRVPVDPTSTLLPYGGLVVSRSLNQVSVESYRIPAPTRRVCLPSPFGSQTRPTRGAKFVFLPFHIASGIPG